MTNVYKIGVSLAMSSNVGQILGVLGRDVLGFHAKVKDLEGGLNRVKLAIGGVMAMGLGVAMVSSLKGPIEKAMEFEQVVGRFRQFGLSEKLNADMVAFTKNTNIAGATYTKMMENIVEAQGIFRESGLAGQEAVNGAKIMAPIMAKIDFNEKILGAKGGDTKDLLKFIESRGAANDPALARKWSDIAYKLSQSSGGIVNYSALRQFGAGVGTLGNNLSEIGIVKLEPAMSDLGGGTTGSGYRVAMQRLLGTQRGLPVQAIHELLGLGLWDSSKVHLNKGGGIKEFIGTPGAVLRDSALIQSDPVAYFQTKFLPAIAKKYGDWILGSDQKAVTARSVEEALVFGPGTASKLFGQIDKLAPAIAKSPSAYGKQASIDEAYDIAKGTTAGKLEDAQAKWTNLMIQVGTQVLPLVSKALDHLIPPMTALAHWMEQHTALVKGLVVGFVGLGGALVAAGAVALAIAAGPVALWTLAIGVVGSAIAGVITWLGGWTTVIDALKIAVMAIFDPIGSLIKLLNMIPGVHVGGTGGKPTLAEVKAANPQLPGENLWAYQQRLGNLQWNSSGQTPHIHVSNQPVQVHTQVNLDGRKVGEAVTKHQTKAASRPNTGGTTFDGSRGMPSVGVVR